MAKLIIGNSYSQLVGLTVKELSEVRKAMSYKVDDNYFSGGFRSPIRHLCDKRGKFPTGLVHLVPDWKTLVIEDGRKRPKPKSKLFNLNLEYPARKEQLEAVEALTTFDRGTLSLVTAFGKTATMAIAIDALQLKTLVIVPNIGLKTQVKQEFIKYFGSLDNITVENIDSSALNNAKDYDFLICDEAHHVAASTYRKLNAKVWNNIYYRAFMTGTAFRSKTEEQMLMESVSGQVIYEVGYKDASAKGYISQLEAYYIEVPKTEIKGNEASWPSMYSELVVNNDTRNNMLADLLTQLDKAGKSTLCLVKEVAHGKKLAEMTGFGFNHGEDDRNRERLLEFNLRENNVLIGTTGVLGEGVDTKPAEYVIIAGLGKSPNSIMQQIGRALRLHKDKETAKVILILDRSHRWTLTHYKKQVSILAREYGIKPVRINYGV